MLRFLYQIVVLHNLLVNNSENKLHNLIVIEKCYLKKISILIRGTKTKLAIF